MRRSPRRPDQPTPNAIGRRTRGPRAPRGDRRRSGDPLPHQAGFKVPASAVRGLTGLDFWDAVVDPMIDPLAPLDGTPRPRILAAANHLIAPTGPIPTNPTTMQRLLTTLGQDRLAPLDDAWQAPDNPVVHFIQAHPQDFFTAASPARP
jgi:hypothetical protein